MVNNQRGSLTVRGSFTIAYDPAFGIVIELYPFILLEHRYTWISI